MRSDRFQTVGNNALRVCNGNAYPFPPVINFQTFQLRCMTNASPPYWLTGP